MIKSGLRNSQICQRTSLPGYFVSRVRGSMGMAMWKRRPTASGLEMIEFLKAGGSNSEFCQKFGLTRTMAAYYKRAAGLGMGTTGRPKGSRFTGKITRAIRDEIRIMKQGGMTYQQIADSLPFDITYQAVQQSITDAPKKSCDCLACGRFCKNPHRHHLNYIHDEVVYLCDSCHRREHVRKK